VQKPVEGLHGGQYVSMAEPVQGSRQRKLRSRATGLAQELQQRV